MDSITIEVENVDVQIQAEADNVAPAQGDTVNFNIVVRNLGTAELKDLKLTAPDGSEIVLSNTSLAVGGLVNATYQVEPTETGSYKFLLNASDDSGNTYSYESNTIDITVGAPIDTNYSEQIQLVVTADTTEYEKNNRITFIINLTNSGENTFQNVKITEESIGDLGIETLATFGPGNKTYTYVYENDITENKNFYFKVNATDPEGNAMLVSANTISIEGKKKSSGGGLGILVWIIIILLLLIIGGGVALFVLIRKDKKEEQETGGQNGV